MAVVVVLMIRMQRPEPFGVPPCRSWEHLEPGANRCVNIAECGAMLAVWDDVKKTCACDKNATWDGGKCVCKAGLNMGGGNVCYVADDLVGVPKVKVTIRYPNRTSASRTFEKGLTLGNVYFMFISKPRSIDAVLAYVLSIWDDITRLGLRKALKEYDRIWRTMKTKGRSKAHEIQLIKKKKFWLVVCARTLKFVDSGATFELKHIKPPVNPCKTPNGWVC